MEAIFTDAFFFLMNLDMQKILGIYNFIVSTFVLIPLILIGTIGFLFYHALNYFSLRTSPECMLLSDNMMRILKLLPTRLGSRIWGVITHIKIPSFMREHVYRLYSFSFGCNLDEISKDLKHYKTMNAFFTRRLKSKVRPIASTPIVSPVDGRVLHFGKADGEWAEQIKGIQYRIKSMLGEDVVDIISSNQPNHLKSKKINDIPDNLYYMVIYLGPGDYHGVHSPTDFTITHSRHFPGHLFSVSPRANAMIRNLLAINERVCMNGFWEHGFFSITSVGAYNVGSITLEFDSEVKTNLSKETAESNFKDRFYENGFKAKKGDCISFFNLGSTVVLFFQAPVNQFKWNVVPYQKIKYGEPLASISKK